MATRNLTRSIFFVVVAIMVIIWLTPLLSTFITALKSPEEAASTSPWALPAKIAIGQNIAFAWETGSAKHHPMKSFKS